MRSRTSWDPTGKNSASTKKFCRIGITKGLCRTMGALGEGTPDPTPGLNTSGDSTNRKAVPVWENSVSLAVGVRDPVALVSDKI